MENLTNYENPKEPSPLDQLYEQKKDIRNQIRDLEKKLGYETDRMMFLFVNKDLPDEEIKEGLGKIESKFFNEPEVKNLQADFEAIESQIQEIEDLQVQEKIDAFPQKKKEVFSKIDEMRNLYQNQYNRYEKKRVELQMAIDEAIQPGIDLGMTREAAINTYLQNNYYGYGNFIEKIEYINNILADGILELEVRLAEIDDLNEKNMNELSDLSSTRFILREIENESFKREVSFLERDLERK